MSLRGENEGWLFDSLTLRNKFRAIFDEEMAKSDDSEGG